MATEMSTKWKELELSGDGTNTMIPNHRNLNDGETRSPAIVRIVEISSMTLKRFVQPTSDQT
jgi:hypothetical protein